MNRTIRKRLDYRDSDHVLTVGERPSAAAIILSRARNEVWSVGDGWMMLDGVPRRFDIEFAEPYTYLRCAYVAAQLRNGHTVQELLESKKDMELIAPFISLQPGIQNNPNSGRYAYGVIDGSDHCIPYAVAVDVRSAREIVLASDGYPTIKPTLQDSEAILKDAITRDPLMVDLFPQTKPVRPGQLSYDDRSYVRLSRE